MGDRKVQFLYHEIQLSNCFQECIDDSFDGSFVDGNSSLSDRHL